MDKLNSSKVFNKVKILFLTNNENTMPLYYWLKEREKDVQIFHDKVDLNIVSDIKPDIIISYNYKYIIPSNVIWYVNNSIYNLHISYLPWNRGSNPNFWSFIDNTPKGVTIHLMDEKLDSGDIIFQKEVFFDENIETLKTTYCLLNQEIQKLFKENWDIIKTKKYLAIKQNGNGSYHDKNDFDKLINGNEIDYNEKISVLKERFL